ncbi:hypothetical protein EV368DRAFT_65365 [Lentinula lateritia]|nr:hypothetical protein EV368DRAFT_65365 [Lentinula lateritia]
MANVISGLTIRLPPLSQVQVKKPGPNSSIDTTVHRSTSFIILSNPALTAAEKEKAIREMALRGHFPLKPNHQPGEVERLIRFLNQGSKMIAFGPHRIICHCGQTISLDNRTYYAWGNWNKHQSGPCPGPRSDEDKENLASFDAYEQGPASCKVDNIKGSEEYLEREVDNARMDFDISATTRQRPIVQINYPVPFIEATAYHARLPPPRDTVCDTDLSRHPLELAQVLCELPTKFVIFSPIGEDRTAVSILTSMRIDALEHRRAARAGRKYSPVGAIRPRISTSEGHYDTDPI